MGNVLAVDEASVTTGYAVFSGGGKLLNYGLVAASPKDDPDKRIQKIINSILDVSKKWNIDTVVLEDLQFQKQNIHSLVILCRLQGALQYAFGAAGMACTAIAPATWHSCLGWPKMDRNACKAASIAYVAAAYQVDITDDDITDAVCIGTAFFISKNHSKNI